MTGAAKEYDYVIVGGGSAGCLLANRLSAKNNSVLLLEAGNSGKYNPWLKIPFGYLYTMGNPKTDWCYVLKENPYLGGRCLDYPRGRVLGGSSAINGMIYIRGQAQDYDNWAAAGCEGWSWREVLPYFVRHENNQTLGGEAHGKNGELAVQPVRSCWPLLESFAEAARHCGIPHTDDFNLGDNFGVAYYQVNQQNGFRQTAAAAFLRPVNRRNNLTVQVCAQARKVLFSGKRAVGVEYQAPQGIQTVFAKSEVILSAGSIGSPQILQNSGVGAPSLLARHGIAVTQALDGVGENLQDHLQIRVAYRVSNARTLNEMSHSWPSKIMMALQYAVFRSGPLASAPSQMACFAHSSGTVDRPDLQYHVQPLTLDSFTSPLHRFPGFTASVCDLRPKSRGYVRISSADPLATPEIDPKHLSAREDRQKAAAAIRHARKICSAPPMAKYEPQEIAPGAVFENDEDLTREAGRISTTIFHPIGTCKMGNDDSAVVDTRLCVRGLEGLRVADASIMPDIVSGNTNAPTLMIAEKAAEIILNG